MTAFTFPAASERPPTSRSTPPAGIAAGCATAALRTWTGDTAPVRSPGACAVTLRA
ncbi:MAG: hypothetical protein HS111_30580 [Kofleriaceae bacterium]|nr:hypothetical protein [Kofleriaceae bacterium]